MSGSVLAQDFLPAARREKALPEAGLRLRCAEDFGEQGCNDIGERKTGENRKAAGVPENLGTSGGPPKRGRLLSLFHCPVQGQGSGFAVELPSQSNP